MWGVHEEECVMFRKRNGFSLIEMLTVITIIGILAGLIFPVITGAKMKAKQSQCMNNLNQIFVGVKMFQQDERRYPDLIAGPAYTDASGVIIPLEKSDGLKIDPSTGEKSPASLYPEYIKSVNGLKCPLSSMNGERIDYSTSEVIDDFQLQRAPYGWKIYQYSSYDFQVPPRLPKEKAEIHYSTMWEDPPGDPTHPLEKQLRWRNPPADTIITWCTFHRHSDAAGVPDSTSRDLVLFLDGHTKLALSSQLPLWEDVWRTVTP
jgi:prepilin-type N-terminal cleavage/methylation domain-containing protein